MLSIFLEKSYKTAIRNQLLDRKKNLGKNYNFQALAKSCGIQKTYLSRVFRDEKTHLNSDQLYLAFEYLSFSQEERQFMNLMFEYERSSVPARRKILEADIETIRKKNSKTERVLQNNDKIQTGIDAFGEYFLDPYMQIMHLFFTVKKYAANTEIIRLRMGLTREKFREILNKLLRDSLVLDEGSGKYKAQTPKMHLTVDSPIVKPYTVMHRLKTVDQILKSSPDKSDSFTVIFSANPDVRKRIREGFLQFLKSVEPDVKKATDITDVYQMNFDLVSWSDP